MRKARLNLYIDNDILDFAKKWSYVTEVPISGMLEEYLRQQRKRIKGVSPFQWLTDPANCSSASAEESGRSVLETYLGNREEAEFCQQNPDHPRAKMRARLLEEYEQTHCEQMERQKKRERALIARWMEVFPAK